MRDGANVVPYRGENRLSRQACKRDSKIDRPERRVTGGERDREIRDAARERERETLSVSFARAHTSGAISVFRRTKSPLDFPVASRSDKREHRRDAPTTSILIPGNTRYSGVSAVRHPSPRIEYPSTRR